MAVLSIRGVREELMRKLKSQAASNGISLREYVVEALEVRVGGIEVVAGELVVTHDSAGGTSESVTAPVAAKAGVGTARSIRGSGYSDKGVSPKPEKDGRKFPMCAHGTEKGLNCWQCGGLAVV